MAFGWTNRNILIVVRTYPVPAQKGAETSCTAAVDDRGEWLRIFPVPYRALPADKRFSKYQWISVDLKKAANDLRPESHNLNIETITLGRALPTTNDWAARRNILRPLLRPSMCTIRRELEQKGSPTLGIFRPKSINSLIIEPSDPEWTSKQKTILSQQSLGFEAIPKYPLEKIPFNFYYQYSCHDDQCKGHRMACTDWEMLEAYRRWKTQYGAGWEKAFRARFERDMIEKHDTHFYVGTLHQHPKSWIVVGLFYPPKRSTGDLFD